MNNPLRIITVAAVAACSASGFFAFSDNSQYWNTRGPLLPLRLPMPPAGYQPEQLDMDGDGRPDAIRSITSGGVPVMWLDDAGTMRPGDREGDMASGTLLIDRNRDGRYAGLGDLIIDWVDTDRDGRPDMQIVIDYPTDSLPENAWRGHYMIVFDTDRDNVFNYIDFHNFQLSCWDHYGLSDFHEDYHGQSAFTKMHESTYRFVDLDKNWENPFLFYDPDNDGLTEMTIRFTDPMNKKVNGTPRGQQSGRIDHGFLSVDLDNDNGPANEFDLDVTLHFHGPGFDYSDMVHPVENLRGNPAHDKLFIDPRYRQLSFLTYPDHAQAREAMFGRGQWSSAELTYDEDDDCGRWERVELYENRDAFKTGWKGEGVDNHKQSDATGDRGEWDRDNSGKGQFYISPLDGKLHLFGAERGVWRIDQDASYFEGWDRMWMGLDRNPKSFATIEYLDTDGNGFFDTMNLDLDGDKKYEETVSLTALGVPDSADVIDHSRYGYDDYVALGKRVADGVWKRAMECRKAARRMGVEDRWYAMWMQPRSLRQRYDHGFWLAFYLQRDMRHHLLSTAGPERVAAFDRAFYLDSLEQEIPGGHLVSPADLRAISASASKPFGREIVQQLKDTVESRRRHSLTIPEGLGGHYHHYFCPKHNLIYSFDWDSPTAHYCPACGTKVSGNKLLDYAWIHEVHSHNGAYLINCAYLYRATGDRKYARYAADMFLEYADKYPGMMEHNKSFKHTPDAFDAGRMFAQSLDESSWISRVAVAYDMIEEAMTPAERASVEKNLFGQCAEMLTRRPAGANWQMWHNSGMAACAAVTGCDSLMRRAIEDPERGYHALIKKHLNSDGWINEGSAHYHFYPLEALLLTANAARAFDMNLFDDDMLLMLEAPVRGTYPDMSFPSHGDGWYGDNLPAFASFYEIANVRFPGRRFSKALAQFYSRRKRSDRQALLSGEDIRPADAGYIQPSVCYDKSGFACLRSGDKTLVFKFNNSNAGGHEHPDKLSFTLHNGKTELFPDFGTSGYGAPEYLGWYKRSLSHSTMNVDGLNQKACKGQLLAFESDSRGGYAAAMTDKAYPGVTMRRSMRIRGNVVTDTLSCSSDSEHVYEYVLLFSEKPEIAGKWMPDTLGAPALPYALDEKQQQSPAYSAIQDVRSLELKSRKFTASTPSAKVEIQLADLPKGTKLYLGTASGIPTNPTISVGSAAVDAAAQPCYTLIIRIPSSSATVRTRYTL